MDNPLTEEQIKELNEIAKLNKEDQQKELQKFLSKLNQEQINFLKKNWGQEQECIFCSIAEDKIKSYKIYENSKYLVVLDINPISEGHCLILPRKHMRFINEVDDDIFNVVKKVVDKIYNIYKCDSNILINNGSDAGQKIDHFSINVIPRYKNDDFSINAKTKKMEDNELLNVAKKLLIIDEIKIKEPEIIEDYFEEERIP